MMRYNFTAIILLIASTFFTITSLAHVHFWGDQHIMNVLLIDNYDSFTYNLFHRLSISGATVKVIRNDVFAPDEMKFRPFPHSTRTNNHMRDNHMLEKDTHNGTHDDESCDEDSADERAIDPPIDTAINAADPFIDAVVISPGPCTPSRTGAIPQLLPLIPQHIGLLGVCLGHQLLVTDAGGCVSHAPRVVHGKTSQVVHDGSVLFTGMSSPFLAMRYHSLVARQDDIPKHYTVTAHSNDDHQVMAIAHRMRPWYGVQFHPESVGTPDGTTLIRNFLHIAQHTLHQPHDTLTSASLSKSIPHYTLTPSHTHQGASQQESLEPSSSLTSSLASSVESSLDGRC